MQVIIADALDVWILNGRRVRNEAAAYIFVMYTEAYQRVRKPRKSMHSASYFSKYQTLLAFKLEIGRQLVEL